MEFSNVIKDEGFEIGTLKKGRDSLFGIVYDFPLGDVGLSGELITLFDLSGVLVGLS